MRKILLLISLLISIGCYSATYYVSPYTGNDTHSGIDTTNAWATLDHAATTAIAGDTVFFLGDTYTIPDMNRENVIAFPNSGTSENPICFFNYPGEYPRFDFSLNVPGVGYNTALYIYQVHDLKFKGLEFYNVLEATNQDGVNGTAGVLAYGTYNISFENVILHDIGGPGMNYYSAGTGTDSSYFINCDVYNCSNPSSNNVNGRSDGYFLQIIEDGYILLRGCRAWNCSDDGFNLDGGGIMDVEQCWSFSNGDPDNYPLGDGNGFKTGPCFQGDGVSIYRRLSNCIAAGNHNPDDVGEGFNHNNQQSGGPWPRSTIYNCISYQNDIGYSIFIGSLIGDMSDTYHNNISYDNEGPIAFFPVEPTSYTYNNFTRETDYPYSSYTITTTAADFVSLDIGELDNARKSDGSLPDITFGRLAEGSDLIGAGIDVGMSAVPDIGIDWAWLDLQNPPIPRRKFGLTSTGKLQISRNGNMIVLP